jgi:tellurite resistance protein TehA-like permease
VNQVSWLIYLSGVLPNLAGCLIWFGIVTIFIALIYFFLWYIEKKEMRRWVPTLVILSFGMWIIAAFCPSQETLLAIAASEFGEQLLHTHTANLAEQALDSWLQRQIHPAASPSDANK